VEVYVYLLIHLHFTVAIYYYRNVEYRDRLATEPERIREDRNFDDSVAIRFVDYFDLDQYD